MHFYGIAVSIHCVLCPRVEMDVRQLVRQRHPLYQPAHLYPSPVLDFSLKMDVRTYDEFDGAEIFELGVLELVLVLDAYVLGTSLELLSPDVDRTLAPALRSLRKYGCANSRPVVSLFLVLRQIMVGC